MKRPLMVIVSLLLLGCDLPSGGVSPMSDHDRGFDTRFLPPERVAPVPMPPDLPIEDYPPLLLIADEDMGDVAAKVIRNPGEQPQIVLSPPYMAAPTFAAAAEALTRDRRENTELNRGREVSIRAADLREDIVSPKVLGWYDRTIKHLQISTEARMVPGVGRVFELRPDSIS